MHLVHLTLHDFRSWSDLEVELGPGPSAFVGRNGQGKTNLVEAVDYLSSLGSHRVAGDAPLVRAGTERAVVRAAVVRDERRAVLEVEINPGRSNRARVNRSVLPRARDLLGLVRTVVFSPEDLTLVKGDPADRRRFLDDLMVQRQPRYAGVRADYDRVLKQRNSLLKSLRSSSAARHGSAADAAFSTLEVWDGRLAELGSELVSARLQLVADLAGPLGKAYESVARGAKEDDARAAYRCSFWTAAPDARDAPTPAAAELETALLTAIGERRRDEIERGVSLVGPHRDDLLLTLGPLPVKGYASHGESWSCALALRLAAFELLRAEGDDPVLILDDVFAELDVERRDQLAALVVDAEQVLVTAAVEQDVPAALTGARYLVAEGAVRRES